MGFVFVLASAQLRRFGFARRWKAREAVRSEEALPVSVFSYLRLQMIAKHASDSSVLEKHQVEGVA